MAQTAAVDGVDEDQALMLREVGGDVDAARFVYGNDFSAAQRQGRSNGPRGHGELAGAADSMCPFHYRVVVDALPDGTRAARFPTRSEQDGGGRWYCWFQSYVCGRGALLGEVTAWRWTVIVPTAVELTTRCSYYENRYLASIGKENVENHLGVRFDGPERVVWTRGVGDSEDVIDALPLGTRLVGGERLQLTLGVHIGSGRTALAVREDRRGIAVSAAGPETDLTRADCVVVASAGNHLDSDDDPSRFFRIADVRVLQTRLGQPSSSKGKPRDVRDMFGDGVVPPVARR